MITSDSYPLRNQHADILGDIKVNVSLDAGRSRSISILLQLKALALRGDISGEVVEAWLRHVDINRGLSVSNPYPHQVEVRWLIKPREEVETFCERNPIEVIPDLGENIAAIYLAGPKCGRLVVSEQLASDTFDLAFMVHHILVHVMCGHLHHKSFDVRVEYCRGKSHSRAVTRESIQRQEQEADSGAACLWDDRYANSPGLTDWWCEEDVVPLRIPHRVSWKPSDKIRGRFYSLIRAHVSEGIRAKLYRPLRYLDNVAVVSGEDRHIYLLAPDSDTGTIVRRWIPSSEVLFQLGILPIDVVRLKENHLQLFLEKEPLIEWDEVKGYHAVLQSSTILLDRPSALLANSESRLPETMRWGSVGKRDVMEKSDIQATRLVSKPPSPLSIKFPSGGRQIGRFV